MIIVYICFDRLRYIALLFNNEIKVLTKIWSMLDKTNGFETLIESRNEGKQAYLQDLAACSLEHQLVWV